MIFMLEMDWHCRIYDRSKKFVFPPSLILRFYQNAWVFGHLLFIVRIHFVDTWQHFLCIFSIYFQFYILRNFTTHIIVLEICYCKKNQVFFTYLIFPFCNAFLHCFSHMFLHQKTVYCEKNKLAYLHERR